MIWQLFNAVEKGFAASGDTDTAFLAGTHTPFYCVLSIALIDTRMWS
jgi:hypothetical protein